MRETTMTTLERVLGDQYGFLTTMDVGLLMRDPDMHPVRVMLRLHSTPRRVVTLAQVSAAVEAEGDNLRDVCFPAAEHKDLANTVARRRNRA